MSENDPASNEEILSEILKGLQSDNAGERLQAIAKLQAIKYASIALRNRLEQLALHDAHQEVRAEALATLDLPNLRYVQNRINKIKFNVRYLLIEQINEWEKSGLLGKNHADVIRRRYDFDSAPPPAPKSATVREQSPAAKAQPALQPEPAGARPSLLQSLVSEASIKIYLYLGAFFVIASAAIIGAAVPELRLPILIIGTLIFGGLSLAIKKRLPQPSFALFIVFSFLLPITANTIEEMLAQALGSNFISAGYWVFVYFIMAIIWAGSAWLYESRLFCVTAFVSLSLSLIRIGDIFEAETEFYAIMAGLAALAGLAGVRILKKWKDSSFALPLFQAAQFVQGVTLVVSISVFAAAVMDTSYASQWHFATFTTWALAFGFYLLSDLLFPFMLFPWLMAGALIPIPWFIAAAVDTGSLDNSIILFVWGAGLAIASESGHRFDASRKYSLPAVVASIPTFALAIIYGFAYDSILGMIAALGLALIYTGLQLLRTRWWLWTLALLGLVLSYFAFFNLDFMRGVSVFHGYQTLGISLLFLLPDVVLKKDLMSNLEWRLAPRVLGVIFAVYTSVAILPLGQAGQIAVCFAVYTLFFTAYAIAQRKAVFGYLPAAYLPLTVLFALQHLKLDAWLPILTGLAVSYFAIGVAFRSKEAWSLMIRNSALALGTLISLAALIVSKETGGWYALVLGLLFAAEMYLRRNGLFEIGMPILFNMGAFLILLDLDVQEPAYHLLAYSLVWLIADLLAHLTFTNPRPLSMVVRGAGLILAIFTYGFLFFGVDASIAVLGFGIYTLLFLLISLLYRRPALFYTFTLTLPLFVTFLFRSFDMTTWIHPVIVIAVMYYIAGFIFRSLNRFAGWDTTLLNSGLGLGVIVSIASPILGGLDAAIPVAIAATLWAAQALATRNAWLALPANGFYLLAYFIVLVELNVDEPQFFSMGAALLGLIQHYLLVRAGSKTGAFIMGMLSQMILLGTTYIEMVNKAELIYFFVLFLQSLAVLVYGIVIRSRSLTFFPIGFVVIGVITVVNSALQGVGAIFLIGCAGIILLILGVGAVLLRERISKLGEKLSDWKA